MGKHTGYTDKYGKEIRLGDMVKYPWSGTRSKKYNFIIKKIDGEILAVPSDDTQETWAFLVTGQDAKLMTVVGGL